MRRRGTCSPKTCVCPNCGKTVRAEPGVPCRSLNCPRCGYPMRRA